MILPPKILDSDFRLLAQATKPEIEAHFSPMVRELQRYLNDEDPIRDVQRVRGIRPRGRAFVRPARVEMRHWWFSHHGGRNEAQWNFGMFPCHVRFGIGFNASGGGYGKPSEVEDAFKRFLRLLRRAERKSLGAALEAETFDPIDQLKVSPIDVLLDGPSRDVQHWLFVGRIFRSGLSGQDGIPTECGKGDDSRILSDPALFASELTRTADMLWPMWEQSRKLT